MLHHRMALRRIKEVQRNLADQKLDNQINSKRRKRRHPLPRKAGKRLNWQNQWFKQLKSPSQRPILKSNAIQQDLKKNWKQKSLKLVRNTTSRSRTIRRKGLTLSLRSSWKRRRMNRHRRWQRRRRNWSRRKWGILTKSRQAFSTS